MPASSLTTGDIGRDCTGVGVDTLFLVASFLSNAIILYASLASSLASSFKSSSSSTSDQYGSSSSTSYPLPSNLFKLFASCRAVFESGSADVGFVKTLPLASFASSASSIPSTTSSSSANSSSKSNPSSSPFFFGEDLTNAWSLNVLAYINNKEYFLIRVSIIQRIFKNYWSLNEIIDKFMVKKSELNATHNKQ